MERIEESPLAVYRAHLEKGGLAYQWSPEAQQPVFYPRVICPFTGSDRLEWRLSAGLGTVYATAFYRVKTGTQQGSVGLPGGTPRRMRFDALIEKAVVFKLTPSGGSPKIFGRDVEFSSSRTS